MSFSAYYLLETAKGDSRIIARCFPYESTTLNWPNPTTVSDNGPILTTAYAEIVTNTTLQGFTNPLPVPTKATRFGATATPTTAINTNTTFIGTKPADWNGTSRTLVISIPEPTPVKAPAPAPTPVKALAPLQSGMFASIVAATADTVDSAEVHVHTLYQGDPTKKITYRKTEYLLKFIAVQKGARAPGSSGAT